MLRSLTEDPAGELLGPAAKGGGRPLHQILKLHNVGALLDFGTDFCQFLSIIVCFEKTVVFISVIIWLNSEDIVLTLNFACHANINIDYLASVTSKIRN